MGWENVRLGEVIKHRRGFITISDEKEYKLCRVQLHRRGVLLREVIKGSQIRTKKQQLCKTGDFIVAEMDAKVGGYGFIPNDLDGAIVSSHYYLFELDQSKIRPPYLEVLSQLLVVQDQIKATGSTNYAAIRPQNVLDWEIPLPDIEIQNIIGELYIKINSQCELLNVENTYQLDLLKKLRQQMLQDAVQGKLVPQDPNDEPASKLLERIKAEKEQLIREKKIKKDKPLPEIKPEEIPFELPENWLWCRLGEICTKITDGTHHSPINIEIGDYKYVTAKNIKDSGIYLSNITYISKEVHNQIYARCNPEFGDILYIKDGATTGIVTINNLTEPFSMLSSVALLKPPRVVFNKFLMYSMRSPYFYDATRKDMYGVAITRVTLEKIQNSLLTVPPLSEQYRIVTKIEQLMKLCDKLEQTIQQNQTYTQELLQVALKEALEPQTN